MSTSLVILFEFGNILTFFWCHTVFPYPCANHFTLTFALHGSAYPYTTLRAIIVFRICIAVVAYYLFKKILSERSSQLCSRMRLFYCGHVPTQEMKIKDLSHQMEENQRCFYEETIPEHIPDEYKHEAAKYDQMNLVSSTSQQLIIFTILMFMLRLACVPMQQPMSHHSSTRIFDCILVNTQNTCRDLR